MTAPAPSVDALAYARQAEAMALLCANQRARLLGWMLTVVTVLLAVGVVVAAVVAQRDELLLLLGPSTLVLQALMFQLYGDVSVLGAARAALEDAVNEALGAPALLYESYVAPIRKHPPLVGSVRVLQAMISTLVGIGVVAGVAVALEQDTTLAAGFIAATIAAAIAASLSYRDMMRSSSVASEQLSSVMRRR